MLVLLVVSNDIHTSSVRRVSRIRTASLLASLLLIGLLSSSFCDEAIAQKAFPQAKPEDLDLDIPEGKPIAGGGRRVMVKNLQGKVVVGRVHVEVKNKFVVMLPDGRLISVPQTAATITERPFKVATAEEITKSLTNGDFKGFKSKRTKRFLYVFNCSKEFSTATSRILETMYPTLFRYCKGQGLDVHDPEFPLKIIMFGSRKAFDKYRRMPPGVLAYYNIVNNSVVMYENSELTKVAPNMALKLSISVIAHEVVHQILFNIGVQQRLSRWPAWVSEGLPEYFAPTEAGKRIRWKGLGLVNDMRMYHLIRDFKETGGDRYEWFDMQGNIETRRLDALGYAKSWGTVYILAKYRKKEFAAYLKEISALGPLQKEETPGEIFVKHFGEDYEALSKFVVDKIRKVKYVDPIENQTYLVGMIVTRRGSRSATIALAPGTLRKWRKSKIGIKSYQVRAFPSKTAAVNFAESWFVGKAR